MIFHFHIKPLVLAAPLLFSLLGAFPHQAETFAEEFPKGAVIESVVCKADSEQSYALYLPAAYDSRRVWPILYCFDPRANGKNPVGCFRPAAEAFGFIVVGSNNSKNGPWEPSQKAIGAMVADTRSRFSLDEKRIYAAGFSGGAHVALLFPLALRKPPVAGVIAICNGWPPAIPVADYPKDVAVVAATGIYDFNFWPTRKIGPALEDAGIAHRLLVFPGEHQWPPEDAAREALAWLELRAMKTGRRERDDAWIQAQWAERLERARESQTAGRTVDAFLDYTALIADFRGLGDVAPAMSALEELQKNPEIQKYPDAARAAEEWEMKRFHEVEQWVNAILQAGDARERQGYERKIREAIPSAPSAKTSSSGLAANPLRPMYLAYAEILNAAIQEVNAEKLKRGGALFEIAALIRPEMPFAWFNLALVYSQTGEIKKALQALETAVDKGRFNPENIEKDTDFEPLRKEKGFAQILEKARRKWEPEKK